MTEKVTGYSLIVVGLLTIGFAAFSVYSVFTGKTEAVSLFTFDGVVLPISTLLGSDLPQGTGNAEVEIFPAEVLNQTTNTLAHLFLMGFLSSVGAKIASLGTNLVRPIIVRVNDQKLKSSILDPK